MLDAPSHFKRDAPRRARARLTLPRRSGIPPAATRQTERQELPDRHQDDRADQRSENGTPKTLLSPIPLMTMTLVSNQAPTSAAMMAPTKPNGSRLPTRASATRPTTAATTRYRRKFVPNVQTLLPSLMVTPSARIHRKAYILSSLFRKCCPRWMSSPGAEHGCTSTHVRDGGRGEEQCFSPPPSRSGGSTRTGGVVRTQATRARHSLLR